MSRNLSDPMKTNNSNSATKEAQSGSTKPSEPCHKAGSKIASGNSLQRVPKGRNRKQESLGRFLKQTDLTLDDYKRAPSLSFLGSKNAVIETMRFSNDPSIVSLLEIYDETPKGDRPHIPLEVFALKAGVSFSQLVGAYVLALRSVQTQKAAIVAMQAHPGLVEKTVKFAKKEEGYKDRRVIHEAVGFLPTPKGLNLNIFPPPPPGSEPEGTEPEEHMAPDVNDLFPLINDKQEAWQGSRQKLLEN